MQQEKILFSLLKKEIAATMMQSYPGIDPEISNWKGQNITDFQEDLRIKAGGQLSEKWFYMHMKGESKSLPRIDVLNILCQYAGYSNWEDFRYKKMGKVKPGFKSEKSLCTPKMIVLILITAIILLFIIIRMNIVQNYYFTFIDSDTGEPVPYNNLRVELLMDNESPNSILSEKDGVVKIKTNMNKVSMVVKAQYYLTDTVERTLKNFRHQETISLRADYYSLMISYFSNSDVISWDKRREQLADVFSENAIIYQFPENTTGNALAIYNKWEFIEKITIPSTGLRHLEILDCRYLNGKIVLLRFRIKKVVE